MNFYELTIDCGRQGSLSGTFIASEEFIDSLKGKPFYADDILGKHSELSFTWGQEELDELDIFNVKESTIEDLMNVMPSTKYNGFHVYIIGGFDFFDCTDFDQEYDADDEDDRYDNTDDDE